ncbi:MAG TPA: universal stress protein [Flavobacteriales bacterium]|nr:universal stress protein [Flavobacteriales bacterium]HMR28377.1 universal stress protein [Flavobacteriales bacterium]
MIHIFHPTDLSEAGATAFRHALRLAVAAPGKFTILHVTDGEAHRSDLPGVRQALVDWGLLRHPEDEEGLTALRLAVRKVISAEGDPVAACLDHLIRHPAHWLVLGTGQRTGADRLLKASVAEGLMRKARVPALVVPAGVPGFVLPDQGRVALHRVLLPVGPPALSRMAGIVLHDLLQRCGVERVEVHTLTVGEAALPADLHDRLNGRAAFTHHQADGDVVDAIVDTADRLAVDLVAMATEGHDSVGDALWGSRAEQVLRRARTPVLVAPSQLPV